MQRPLLHLHFGTNYFFWDVYLFDVENGMVCAVYIFDCYVFYFYAFIIWVTSFL